MPKLILEKIVSGGQTGVDRAALDVAIFLEIDHGGWCPQGRRAEDGRIPPIYQMKQTRQRDYAVRTEKNVVDSDGTLVLFRQQTTGGTELTRKLAMKYRRPLLCIDLENVADSTGQQLIEWIEQHGVKVLNIAGPRESTCAGITRQTEQLLVGWLQEHVRS